MQKDTILTRCKERGGITGQSEINLGVIPGAGSTQRLSLAISRAAGIDMALTGQLMDSAEALQDGLIFGVVPFDALGHEAFAAATSIVGLSLPRVFATKECANVAYETTSAEGVAYERRNFQAQFGTPDQEEGIVGFVEKRMLAFNHA